MIKLADDMMDVRFLGPTDEDDEEWLDDEELDADQLVVFAGGDHFADDTGQLNQVIG